MIVAHAYAAEQPGPRFLALGAVHGNETCGTVALQRLSGLLESGALKLLRGRLTLVPVCNPRAFAQGVRFTERDLNRYLVPMEKPDCYEARLGNVLTGLLADCDALLDIHSYTIGGPPFLVLRTAATAEEQAYANALGAEVALTGWAEAYAASGRGGAKDSEESTGTTEYARRGGAQALTLECGQHRDPAAPEIAFRALLNALEHFGMLAKAQDKPPPAPPRRIRMTQVYYHTGSGELAKTWANFEPVAAGTLLARRGDGEEIRAPHAGVVVMPRPIATAGEEWFYLGQPEDAAP